MPSAVTATSGRYPAWSLFGGGPSSCQFAAAVKLQNTPTSVATYTLPGTPVMPGSTTIVLAGALGKAFGGVPVKSAHEFPPSVVFHACEVGNCALLKPMMLTKAV